MLGLLLVLLAANGFISTAANDDAVAIADASDGSVGTRSKIRPEPDISVIDTAPIEPNDEVTLIKPELDIFVDDTSPIEPINDEVPPDSTVCKNATLTCADDEYLDNCPSYCPSDFCPTGEGQNKNCPQPKPCPPPACKCRFNSRRAQNGKCIPTRQCPAFECNKPNEVYNPCPPLCPTDSCTQATPTGRCPLPGRIGIILECNPTCRCKEGYWRLDNGTCVPYNQCPGKLTCGPNEVVDNCPVDCPSDYCPTSNALEQSCPKPSQCPPPACKCAFNYRRAKNGTCIPTRDCPAFECFKPNEEYNPCPPLCPNDDCSQATPDGRCPLPGRIGIVLPCTPKCRCKKNYWRLNGICVPYKKCPGVLKCPPGDVVDECPQFCNTDYCPKNQNDVRICSTPIRCPEPACKCPFNHLRAANGTCIPASSCPPIKCTRPHEVYNSCPPACPSDDCKDATPSGECPIPGRIGIVVECRPGCRCEKSYWRQNGTCVPFGQCGLDCSGPNEYYACGGACDNVCKDLHFQSQNKCPIINIKCNDKCYCNKGFARDDKGICIPISQCPKNNDKKCPFPNEEYTDCKKKCPSDKCSSVVEKCIPSETCSPGCVCSPGYLRPEDEQPCIPSCQCPQLRNTQECIAQNSEE